jgi:hypothetical protein
MGALCSREFRAKTPPTILISQRKRKQTAYYQIFFNLVPVSVESEG